MSRDGSGNYLLPSGNPVVTNTIISSTWANATLADVAAALTQSLSKDGQTTPTANLTMGNFRLTSLAAAIARTDAVNAGQVQDNQLIRLTSIGGTGDAITAATAPALTAIATDSKYVYTPTTTNATTTPTIAIDGLSAVTIVRSDGGALAPAALVVGVPYELLYDGTNFRVQSGQMAMLTPPGLQSVSASVAASALTVGYASQGPLQFRSSTLTSGAPSTVENVGALSLTVPTGATLGTVSGAAATLAILALNNAGAVQLGIVNISGSVNLDETTLVNSTAVSGSSTSANTIYSTSSLANVPFRVLGYLTITEATAGTWATAPTLVQGMGGMSITEILGACAAFGASLSASGYQKLPNGLIIQWGTPTCSTTAGTNVATGVTFPIAFPNAALAIVTNPETLTPNAVFSSAASPSKTGFSVVAGSNANGAVPVFYIAIGN